MLIALSWFHIVSPTIGSTGFAIGMAGSAMGWGLRPPRGDPRPRAPDENSKP